MICFSVIPPVKETPVWESYNSFIVLAECLSEMCALCERGSFEFCRGDSRTWFRCIGLFVIKEIIKSFNSGQFRVTKLLCIRVVKCILRESEYIPILLLIMPFYDIQHFNYIIVFLLKSRLRQVVIIWGEF